MAKKRILIMVALVICLVVIFFAYFSHSFPDLKPAFEVQKIHIEKSDKLLYLKAVWTGITSDHEMISLSENTDITKIKGDSATEYLYHGSDFLFYRTSQDSLLLYVYQKSKVPLDFKSNVKIVQIELENRYMMELRHNHIYQGKSVKMFPQKNID